MLREHYDLLGILKRMAEGNSRLAPLKRDWVVTELMLALVVFHRHVIAQFQSVERAMQQMKRSGISSVQLGDTKIGADGLVQMEAAIRKFYGLIAKFQFPNEILLEHDIKVFAQMLADYLKGKE
jgi:hypothetical protein